MKELTDTGPMCNNFQISVTYCVESARIVRRTLHKMRLPVCIYDKGASDHLRFESNPVRASSGGHRFKETVTPAARCSGKTGKRDKQLENDAYNFHWQP